MYSSFHVRPTFKAINLSHALTKTKRQTQHVFTGLLDTWMSSWISVWFNWHSIICTELVLDYFMQYEK